ncbi:MAG: DUF4342 domain-containing protein [Atopobiaceae bacterium]|nr:DUF4342 domain-containing protein [Atopobiaceae bacterium]
MENLEKVELVREKCNVSYEEARNALEACDYDVLDAIVMLEQANKVTERMPKPIEAPEADSEPEAEYEAEPEAASEPTEPKTTKAGRAWKSFCAKCKELFGSGMETTFVAERNGERFIAVPLLVLVFGLLLWGATIWLLIIGLFFGFRYRIEGTGKAVAGVNEAMDKAADAAEDIKQNVA